MAAAVLGYGEPLNLGLVGMHGCRTSNKAIDEAVEEANAQGIHGKETTPFLLAKVKELTGGDSLDSNIQLVFNNARLAARTAAELVKLG